MEKNSAIHESFWTFMFDWNIYLQQVYGWGYKLVLSFVNFKAFGNFFSLSKSVSMDGDSIQILKKYTL